MFSLLAALVKPEKNRRAETFQRAFLIFVSPPRPGCVTKPNTPACFVGNNPCLLPKNFRFAHGIECADASLTMKDISFELAMNKIAGQAEAERQNEIRVEQRRHTMNRVRGIFISLLVVTLGVIGLCYHAELQEAVYSKLHMHTGHAGVATAQAGGSTTTTTEGKLASSLDKAQSNAAVRDNLIDSLAK
jgi:hypothetical protein